MSEEDIQILRDQTNISRDLAKKLIIFKGGDLVECILEIENHPDLQTLEDKIKNNNIQHKSDEAEKIVDVSKKENLSEYRDIVDQKDTIYNYKSEQKEKRKRKLAESNGEEEHLCNEKIYFSSIKDNITHIRVL